MNGNTGENGSDGWSGMNGDFVEKKKNFFKGLFAPKNSYNFVD